MVIKAFTPPLKSSKNRAKSQLLSKAKIEQLTSTINNKAHARSILQEAAISPTAQVKVRGVGTAQTKLKNNMTHTYLVTPTDSLCILPYAAKHSRKEHSKQHVCTKPRVSGGTVAETFLVRSSTHKESDEKGVWWHDGNAQVILQR